MHKCIVPTFSMGNRSGESFACKMVRRQKLGAMRKCLGTAGSTAQERKQAQGCYVIPVHGHMLYKLQTVWALKTSLLHSKMF